MTHVSRAVAHEHHRRRGYLPQHFPEVELCSGTACVPVARALYAEGQGAQEHQGGKAQQQVEPARRVPGGLPGAQQHTARARDAQRHEERHHREGLEVVERPVVEVGIGQVCHEQQEHRAGGEEH